MYIRHFFFRNSCFCRCRCLTVCCWFRTFHALLFLLLRLCARSRSILLLHAKRMKSKRNTEDHPRQHKLLDLCNDHIFQFWGYKKKKVLLVYFTLISHSIHNNGYNLHRHRRKRWQFYYNRLLRIIMKSADVFDRRKSCCRLAGMSVANAMIQSRPNKLTNWPNIFTMMVIAGGYD